MKILLYNVTIANYVGGIETFYWEVAKILDNKAIIYSGKGDKIPSWLKSYKVEIKMFDYTPKNKVFPDLGNRFKKFMKRVSFFKSCKDSLKNEKFDVIVISKPFDFFVAFLVKKYNPNVKTIFVSGGEDFYFFDKFFIRYIDKIISVSKENAKLIQNRYKNREVKVIPNGVDKKQFCQNLKLREEFRKKLKIDKNEIVFASVGRVVGWKGFELVIKVLKDFPKCKYILAGNGKDLSKLKDLAKELNVANRVIFLGEVLHSELNKVFNSCDVYIQPSIGHEAFGITLIEALSCNRVCVASDNGGMKSIIENGVNGFKFEISNLVDLKEKINLAIENRGKLNPRASIEGKYEWRAFVKEFLDE